MWRGAHSVSLEHGSGVHVRIANSWCVLVTIIQVIFSLVGLVLEVPTGGAVFADDGYAAPVGCFH